MLNINASAPVEVFIDGVRWREVTELTDSGPNESVFCLNRETGELLFGDGARGKRLPPGAEITIRYRTGGGEGGNNPRLLRTLADEVKPFKRVRYFDGKLLSANDLNAEQNYLQDKRRLRNRLLVGAGAVSGLRVTVGQSGFQLSPGIAIDGQGNEIVVPSERLIPFPVSGESVYLALAYLETPTDPVPVSSAGNAGTEFSRIEEGFTVGLLSKKPDSNSFVLLGKFVNRAGRWTLAIECSVFGIALGAICLISTFAAIEFLCFHRVRARMRN